MLTLGIIGAGHMGTLHAQNLMTDERVHLVGVADVDQDRAETLAHLVKGQTFASVEALLDTGVEAVYVCTPNTLHTEAVLAALPLLDMLRWLMGEVVEVVCQARASIYHELDDFVMRTAIRL